MKLKHFTILLVTLAVAVPGCSSANSSKGDAATAEISSNSSENSKKSAKTIHLTKSQFLQKVVNYEKNSTEWKYLGDKPAIVDFYASWCGPCKQLAPVLEELAAEYEGEIYIYKVDTEAETELASAFGITSIPTILFIPMGEDPQVAQGALPKDVIKNAIEKTLLKR
ncbi:MAG: thioredoxin [Bacteroidetes bacterium HGW-Bacteroidetes-14]|jgi:thioredoxin|nr:MAG: thioredoxin [Bacteroidetes bacterium HGW-Bacteroidetes-14]